METLANLESFVRSADLRGFSAAARQLGLTPAAVSRNVAVLERNLGLRLFQRSTRKLTLTESGERFLDSVREHVEALNSALSVASVESEEPAGTLKLSMAPGFGMDYVLPLMPQFLRRHPHIRLDWLLENRQVDLIAEGFDAAIGGGIELAAGMVARPLAPLHVIAVAAPTYLQGRPLPAEPEDLAEHDGIAMRSARTGRVRHWAMRDSGGREAVALTRERIVLNDPEAMCRAALNGLGVTLVAVQHALPYLDDGRLQRLLPDWYADLGSISLYYASRNLLPSKTRVFVDYLIEACERARLPQRLSGRADAGAGVAA
ncbi:LysR family transcriptional regulator [Lysobacter gummosus]|uniref:LysR family transcriptional regulator n=1 Tax=Lysobacter gummosus TaxID=262324 RepID=A0ABY3XK33_9GAMM|nr:LysR family transcriptional regulator [Lysobacter gummosus]ALN91653.1 bacterial regulatory helix-turn-helix, lysR family protein [Lysobacter gummosus]UNP31998.1 LysR family transcriptional regulator [Lysobacter gummosus]